LIIYSTSFFKLLLPVWVLENSVGSTDTIAAGLIIKSSRQILNGHKTTAANGGCLSFTQITADYRETWAGVGGWWFGE